MDSPSKLLLALVAGFGLLLGTAQADVPKTILDSLNQNVVEVKYNGSTGTGFYVTPRYILTNRHVVSYSADRAKVEDNPVVVVTSADGGGRYVVELVNYVTDVDLALFYCKLCPADSGKGLPIATRALELGTSLWSAGFGAGSYGLHEGLAQLLVPGTRDRAAYLTHSVPTTRGDSGSPIVALIDGVAAVVGVIEALRVTSIPDKDGNPDYTLVAHKGIAVPVVYIHRILRESLR